MKKEIEENLFKGRKKRISCRRCSNSTLHEIIYSYDIRSVDEIPRENVLPPEYTVSHQIIRCCGCEDISYRYAYLDSAIVGKTPAEREIEYVYPQRRGDKKPLPFIGIILKDNIYRLYWETYEAYSNKLDTLFIAGCRMLLDLIVLDKKVSGKNLFEKINELYKRQIISEGDKNLLHEVRVLGNEVIHESKKMSALSLSSVLEIIEGIINQLYILPQLSKIGLKKKKVKKHSLSR